MNMDLIVVDTRTHMKSKRVKEKLSFIGVTSSFSHSVGAFHYL